MSILINGKGHVFLDFIEANEEEMMNVVTDTFLTHALVVAEHQEDFLLMFDKRKQLWELPGGVNWVLE